VLRYHRKMRYAETRKKQGDTGMNLKFRKVWILLACMAMVCLAACAKTEQQEITKNVTGTEAALPPTETPVPTAEPTATPKPTKAPTSTPTPVPTIPPEMEATTIMAEAEKFGFTFGTVINNSTVSAKSYTNLIKKEFNSITAGNEMKAYSMLNQQASIDNPDGMPVMNYAVADKIVGFAEENGIGVRGHVLVWDAYMCDWFFREGYTNDGAYVDEETIKARVKYYIEEVITHFETEFPGVVYCWDVVNEAVGDSSSEYVAGDLRHLRTMRSGGENLFYKIMGPEYVELSFLYAKDTVEKLQQQNPDVSITLFYNDYNTFHEGKRNAICELIKSINSYATDENGEYRILCEGVGMQSYIGGYGSQDGCMNEDDIEKIKKAVKMYHNLGMEVHVTEMAVRNYDEDKMEEHAEFYGKLFEAYAQLNARETLISNISIWGINDNPSMPKSDYSYKMNSPYCGLFTKYYQRKDAYYKALGVIMEKPEGAKLESVMIPGEYTAINTACSGTIKEIEYKTYAYYGNGEELTKKAFVYLPPQYDETKQYNVLYLMHGIGGNEREWGMINGLSQVKLMMDNLIAYGDIEPFIVVTPNGRSSADFANTNADFNSFYVFGQELRNDLIPYIEANFATYAEYDENGYDLTVDRDHRAMAGLSMGGMQTINIGLCECLDIMSWYGAFSAAPTSNPANVIAEKLAAFPEEYDIHYFYNICGLSDGIALSSARNAVLGLTAKTDRLEEDKNFMWQEVGGAHDFKVWYLGFYNFAQMVFDAQYVSE